MSETYRRPALTCVFDEEPRFELGPVMHLAARHNWLERFFPESQPRLVTVEIRIVEES